MENFKSFKRMEVIGSTKDEAFAKAPFEIMGDATQAYKLWKQQHTSGITDTDIKQFMIDYLNKKSKNVTGVGFSITLESAIADTRERPYSISDIKNTKGARSWETVYQVVDEATGNVLAKTNETKAKAKELIRSLYIDKNYKGNCTCYITKQVKDGEPIAFTSKYTPSKGSRCGRYMVFGFERV